MTDPIGPQRRPPIGSASAAGAAPRAAGATAASALPPLAPVTIPQGTVEKPSKDGTFSYVTTMNIKAPPEQVLKALQGDWNLWWKGGQASNVVHRADGTAAFDLAPVHGPIDPIKVHVEVGALRAEPLGGGKDGFKVVMPVTLSGSFSGQAGFTITQAPDGSTNLQSTWTDVAPHGVAKGMGHLALQTHFGAENNALRNLGNYLNGRPLRGITGLLDNPLTVTVAK